MSIALTITDSAARLKQVEALIRHALETSGEAQKQWYLERIADHLGVELRGMTYPRGVAPGGDSVRY